MKLGELAMALDIELHGNAEHDVVKLGPIHKARATDLTFVVGAKYRDALQQTQAGAVILPPSLAEYAPGHYFISDNPYASYARASWILSPEIKPQSGIHPTAVIDSSATVAATASIGAFSVIGANTVIEQGCIIGEQCVISEDCFVGAGSRLFPRVTLYHGTRLGEQCRIHSGAVLGSDGFGYAYEQGWQAIHQTGCVVIGDNVHIGANTTIDRGAIDNTEIADGVILDNHIQIAHNVQIGKNTAIAACVGIAGSTTIGKSCQIGGACNIVGHLSICDGVTLSATSFVTQSIGQPGRYSSGMPLQSSSAWRRSFVALSRLDDMLKRLRRLERNVTQ